MLWPSRITALSRFKELFVIARNSSFVYKGKHVDIRNVGRDLGVRSVLEGSIRRAGPSPPRPLTPRRRQIQPPRCC